MRYIAYFLLLVIAAFNYQLWFGKGGWNDVWELEQQIEQQKVINEQQKQQNQALAG
ncbi:MAG: septum formation initiator family protein, partial [Neisseriaceae bacterium]|nr:septum formation initiator family protein [Neisseriaceae bacterium]